MTIVRSIFTTLVLAAGVAAAGAAQAHPKLLSSTPAAQAQSGAPGRIELHFSEPLVPRFSGARLLMTGMPGMGAHAPMAIKSGVSAGDDPKTMIIVPAQPLVPGTYRVEWRAVSSDTHTVTGNFSFEVK
ncbi:copper homeostasis periplasmic binding protein CopC [Bordetella bronchialis]|uniref:Copper resistance protein CopC n=1 Tax=Bordetella bronchialis TaxID=463025 RepID=A0A193FH78_9BORD|nr:copper homeostasis periplasmic binding protein CopC [Bordetella bronchialis]ANN67092.1 copper resistance protein CopC [Bordetella bronchialis]ANN72172.1 copper resistance protein CopC [Bordetella bronchialis]